MDFAPRRPSWIWHAAAALLVLAALATAASAVRYQQEADRPVGEGQLFLADSTTSLATALHLLDIGTSPGDVVRRIRNELEIEAVSLIDTEGMVVASSTASLVAQAVAHPVLLSGLEGGRFAAVITPTGHVIEVDGVIEWMADDPLYAVLLPGETVGMLMHYDPSLLLARRSSTEGIRPETVQLLAAAGALLTVAGILMVGRYRVARRNREAARESSLLRAHSEELEVRNRELTEARRAAEEALALAEEKNRVRSEFVLMINHELRTPLTAVVTGAELLRSDDAMGPVERTQVLDAVIADGRRLEEMIDEMLTVARIENRGLNVTFESVPLIDVVRAVLRRCPSLLLEPLPPHVANHMVTTDEKTLTQLLASLANNGFQHGAARVALSCHAELPFSPDIAHGERPSAAVHFLVTDDGPGIPREFLPRLFERYEKRSFSSGTGLGMYLASLVAEALRGSIAVSTSRDGTVMAVSIPAEVAVSPAHAPAVGS